MSTKKRNIIMAKERPQLTELITPRSLKLWLQEKVEIDFQGQVIAGNLLIGQCPISSFLTEVGNYQGRIRTGLKSISINRDGLVDHYRWPKWANSFYYYTRDGSRAFKVEPTYRECLDRLVVCERLEYEGFPKSED